ncbi:hypothetical protein SprV_0301299200 [Sparganum proliferum]
MPRKLNFLRERSVTSVNSASLFLADIPGKSIRSDQIMVSFDVVSLFTSIPPDLARDVLRKRLEVKYDETTGPLKIQHLMQLFAFCQRTFFTFDGRTYEQIKATPMGSPISSLVAELVLQELEKVAFSQYKPAFWRRYVEDTFVIIEKDKLSGFQDLLNCIFPDIQITREDVEDEKLPFLDVLVTRTPDDELSTTVYKKATNTTQVLNYHSNHPLVYKRGCVRALFDRDQLEDVDACYTFWNNRPTTGLRDAGVAFAIQNDVGRLPCLPQVINDRLIILRYSLRGVKLVTVVSAYVPPTH